MVLEGWEVKSLRESKVQLKESYVFMKKGEAFLNNSHISPLNTVSSHIVANPTRSRKLLLNEMELIRLGAAVERKGYTIVPLILYWKKNRVKLEIGLGKGKQLHDKRAVSKERDSNRDIQREFKNN